MSDKTFKVNEAIEVVYQAAGAATGIVVTMDVYDEAGVKDVAQSGAMVEIGATGRYTKTFTPDAEGDWITLIGDARNGKAVKAYSVGSTNLPTVDAAVAAVDAKVVIVDGKIDDVQTAITELTSPPMIG